MTRVGALLLLAAGALAGAEPGDALALEEAAFKAAWCKRLHAAANWAERHALKLQAIRLWEAVLAVDPDDENARRKLGWQKSRRGWGALPERRRELAGWLDSNAAALPALADQEVSIRLWTIQERLRLGRSYADRAPEGAEAQFEAAVALDPECAEARDRLGFVKEGTRWILGIHRDAIRDLPERLRLIKEAAAQPIDTSVGKDFRPEERAAGLPLARVESRIASILSTGDEAGARDLAETAERALRFLLALLPRGAADVDPLERRRFTFLHLRTREEYLAVVAADATLDDEAKAFASRLKGARVFGYASAFEAATPEEARDVVAYQVVLGSARILGCPADRNTPWLAESLALLATQTLLGTAGQISVRHEHTTEGGRPSDRALELQGWQTLLRGLVTEGKDPALAEILRTPRNALDTAKSAKAWSVIDYLLFVQPEPGRRTLTAFMAGEVADPWARWEKGVREGFGLTPARFEKLWRQWVLDAY
ncbi:MAG: hypothetical protein ACT4PV_03750 [Planctomycetaceae bacterium]